MDYHAIHGHDIASFDTSGTHRLPTIAASQALLDLEDETSTYIPTGLDNLDKSLQDLDHAGLASSSARHGGIKRRQVTELWGPPGSGKTAIGIQAAANTICSGKDVIWIDCFQQVHRSRVSKVLKNIKLQKQMLDSQDAKLGKLTHYSCLTLPHLMALISRPAPKNTTKDVALVVVDSASALINSALPRAQDRSGNKPSKGPNTSTRRLQALQAIVTSLQKYAATKNSAVLVLSQCATKMHSDGGAAIVSALNARVWEQGISTRLVLFRDWMWADNKSTSIFLMALQKLDGKTLQDSPDPVCTFTVEVGGARQVQYQAGHPLDLMATIAPQKRKLDEAELEVPDSEDDEDYGWAEEDEADLPPPPPQWQGSEDIILGQELGHSEDEYTDEEQQEVDSQGSGQPDDEGEVGP